MTRRNRVSYPKQPRSPPLTTPDKPYMSSYVRALLQLRPSVFICECIHSKLSFNNMQSVKYKNLIVMKIIRLASVVSENVFKVHLVNDTNQPYPGNKNIIKLLKHYTAHINY